MSSLSTLPKGDSAWLLRKAIERIMEQVSVLETNIGSSTTGNSANTQIIFNDNGTLRGDAGLVYNKTTDALTVAGLVTAGSATITGALTSGSTTLVAHAAGYTGKVGIGTATPASTLHVKGTVNVDADYNLIDFYKTDGTTRLAYFNFRSDGPNYLNVNSNQPLYLSTNNTVQVQVETSGDVKINTGNVVMGTSGKGIDFSATSHPAGMTSELLNDYEEGTWTIGLAFGGASVGLTTSSSTGRYTKVGRQVTVTGLLVLTSKGSSTGGASVTGLPFSIGNSNDSYPAASLRLNGISYVGAFQAFGTIGSTFISFEQISTLGAVASLTDANFTNASSFIFTLTYFV